MSGVAIIGGGPAGAATAIALARGGMRPLLLEREAVVTEKVCGEFLSEGAGQALRRLGLDLAELGAAPIRRAIIGAGAWQAELTLPFAAWSLPRATLDSALLEAALAAGVEVRRGVPVREAAPGGNSGWRLRLGDGARLEAAALVLASGKHDLRGLRRAAQGGAVGVKLPLRSAAPEAAVTLLACGSGYAGLLPRPGGGANLCAALLPGAAGVAAALRAAEPFLDHVRRGSALAERLLAGARPALARPMVVAGIPYGFLHRGGGPFRVGDQVAVVPSLCGDGVAMALWSGLRAAGLLQARRGAEAYHAGWARQVASGMRLAGLLSVVTLHRPALLAFAVRAAPRLSRWAARRTRLGVPLVS